MKLLDAPSYNIAVSQKELPTEVIKSNQSIQTNNTPYIVTDNGVVIPNEMKYQIPANYIENTKAILPNSTSYGLDINGKFVEKLRIDAGTLLLGYNLSTFDLYSGRRNIVIEGDPLNVHLPSKRKCTHTGFIGVCYFF